ncbi:MAG TPA: DUF2268 domain-containing putative Zn-dependent protease [Chitinophagaceae bacterium]|nr:DUF2268 domain-containing putative Zn-dependent protease [Chitinophagaceae bacterium]
MKQVLTILSTFLSTLIWGQSTQKIELNKNYPNISIEKTGDLKFILPFVKGGVYKISVMQQGIDVVLQLMDKTNKQLLEKDSPNGPNGLETFDYTANEKEDLYLVIKRLDQGGNPDKGTVSVFVKQYSKAELAEIDQIKKELEPENRKVVQTLDIDHFWEAYDNLKKCKSRDDSINSLQKIYLDRATDGLKDFIQARQFTAEKFVRQIARFPKFYNSIRENTYEARKSVPIIEEVVNKFKEIYPNFKPKKVCFAIGLVNTGGTVSDDFLLIGTEITTCTKDDDLSEFNNSSFSKVLAKDTDIVQNIKNMVSHEYVHTQQSYSTDSTAINCPLLYSALREGICDFIGELISNGQINKVAQEYGDKHEKKLWIEFKNELCNQSIGNWLYNYGSVKDKPADLGYYIGYKIAQEYYKNALDKKQAIIDIIEMKDPIQFLQLSKYDQKIKK